LKNINGLLTAAAIVCGACLSSSAFAKTAKDCTAEWRADKAGMQARGVTEKAYVEQCRGGGADPTAAAPSAKPPEAVPPAPRQATATGSKTAKDCTAEWRADKAGMQARGVTERAYVEQCKTGSAPAASTPEPRPTAATPAPAAPPPQAGNSQKTAKDCIAEWRADKAGMQARGTTEKAYVDQCRAGGAVPSANAPEPKPTAAAPPPPPSRTAPTATEAAPPAAPQRPAPTTTAAPVPAPAQQPSKSKESATLEAGQFADDASAKATCPTDTVVWVNLPSKIYHFVGTKSYGTTRRGAYMCEKQAIAGENRASKTETHP
jgi:hypothetical protein